MLAAVSGQLTSSYSVTLPATGVEPYTVKPGPFIARVLPSAANVLPLSLAPGMFVSIYGTSLADPTAQLLFNGISVLPAYTSAIQINAVIPDGASGLATLTVRNGAGSHTVNVFVEAAMPAIFTLDGSGTGSAAAINASNNRVVGGNNPLHAGDYVELYATGLGATTNRGALDYPRHP